MEIPSRHDTILRLRLIPAGDRLAHALELDQRGQSHSIAATVEGTATDRWPPSPPLIDIFPGVRAAGGLGEEHRTAPTSLLATGAAGTSFWSLAITRTEHAIVFDHACRLHAKAEGFLGSTYELRCPLVMVDEWSATLRTPLGNVQVGMHPLEDHVPSMRLVGGRLVFSVRSDLKTVRWQYRFSLTA